MTASVELRRLAADIERLPRSSIIAAARAAKAIVQQDGARIAGPDGMKGKKRRGLKLRARDTIRDGAHETTCRVQGTVPAWVWANTGTRPHTIRRRKRGPLRQMTVQHPGTPGRGAWARTERRIEDLLPRIFTEQLDRIL